MTATTVYMPSDKEAEQNVISACFHSKEAVFEMLQALTVSDFNFVENRHIFTAIKEIHKSSGAVNLNTIKLELKKTDTLTSVGGSPVIASYDELGRSLGHCAYMIKRISDCSMQRQLIVMGKELISDASTKTVDPVDALRKLQANTSSVGSLQKKTFFEFEDILSNFNGTGQDFFSAILSKCNRVRSGEDCFDGYRSGYSRLDKLIGGFQKGTLNIIGARSSSGKTTLLVNLIMNVKSKYKNSRVAFFSLEMSKERIAEKIMCMYCGINYQYYNEGRLSNEELSRIEAAQIIMRQWMFPIYDISGISIAEMQSQIRKEIVTKGLDMVVIDYMTRIQSDEKTPNKHLEIDKISKGLQTIAINHNIPVICLAQLSRAAGIRADKRPQITDLRESGSIEEDADVVMLMHRPKAYSPELKDDITEIYVVKNRLLGELGRTRYEFNKGRLIEMSSLDEIVVKENICKKGVLDD